MPAILTHYTFALKAIPEEDKPYQKLVNLGSQGPDTFMAYGTIPWIKRENKKKVQGFGHAMHRLDVAETYLKMAEYAKQSDTPDLLFAFLDGLFMHYCVDRIMHAYIFYRSGIDEHGGLSGYYSWSHGFFEAILDKVFAKRRGTYQKLSKCILTDDEQVKLASKMWQACSPTPLNEDDYYLSYRDFVSAENMLWTPHGAKRPFFKLLGKYSTPYSQAHPGNIHKFDKLDVTND
ncbi:MAG: zinc dependent phospholipase C family protein, partial [Bacilli bacterium]|nr:zinc dependent phospholipase C family protein [Bacilli bacterium]